MSASGREYGRALYGPPVDALTDTDALCALFIDRAPRFGAVAAHFPESLRQFVAGFWAPEVFFSSPDGREGWYRDLPESPRTRAQLDSRTADIVKSAWLLSWFEPERVVPRRRYFWSPELPEVIVLEEEGVRCFCVKRSEQGGSFPWWPLAYAFQLLLCLALPAGVL